MVVSGGWNRPFRPWDPGGTLVQTVGSVLLLQDLGGNRCGFCFSLELTFGSCFVFQLKKIFFFSNREELHST